jgi:hypothetical protein
VLYLAFSNAPEIISVTDPLCIFSLCVNPACEGGNVSIWVIGTSLSEPSSSLLASEEI